MAVEASVIELRAIAPEQALPPVEAPPFLLGERRALGDGDRGAVLLDRSRASEIVLRPLDGGVAVTGEARQE